MYFEKNGNHKKGEELSKEKAKVFSYPKHELIEKHMKDLKLLDRAVLPGTTAPSIK